VPGRHFAVTWSIPDNFGGMTTALLQRSRAFVRLGGASVDILTFEPRADYPLREAALRDSGELIDGMRLLNLYEWLRHNPLPGGSLRPQQHPFTPLSDDGASTLIRTRQGPDGTILQVDHYRCDGTLLLTDRRDTRERGVIGGRSIVLCDAAGVPVRSWGRIHHLYAAWLDRLTDRQPSSMIVDSKTIAGFMLHYRRAHVTTVHVVHASHRGRDGVRASRRDVFENLDRFDVVVVLTDGQRHDVRHDLGRAGRVRVIPNATSVDVRGDDERDPRSGVVLASLTPRKRVAHAMRAAAMAGATLDVYGDGELRGELTKLADELGDVRLHGYRADAREEFTRASFLLATGSSEGFPLALIEGMAAGCIPIAYDVPYGPADLIDGVNGILVPSGDQAALAAAIEKLIAETPAQLARRRRHARRTAQRYTDAVITERWARELRAAWRRKRRAGVVRRVRAGAKVLRRAS